MVANYRWGGDDRPHTAHTAHTRIAECQVCDGNIAAIILLATPLFEEALRVQIKEEDRDWNEAVDWLLNSRHTGDPDIQAAFWNLANGRCNRKEADDGFTEDGRSMIEVETDAEEHDVHGRVRS